MATSRTGTSTYRRNRARALHRAQQDGITHCPHCNIQLDYTNSRRPNSAEADHIIPASLGGTDDVENLTPCCRLCNQRMGNKTPNQQTKPKQSPTALTPTTSEW